LEILKIQVKILLTTLSELNWTLVFDKPKHNKPWVYISKLEVLHGKCLLVTFYNSRSFDQK